MELAKESVKGKRVKNNNVLITAGASGIGKSIAEKFFQNQYKVWIVDKDQKALDRCPNEWEKTKLDVSEEDKVNELFLNIKVKWGSLDVLCANAGIKGPTKPIEEISINEWRECISVNLDGIFIFSKFTSSLMKEQKFGSIIITASTVGIFGLANRSPYSASKWGVIGLMKTLAIELGPFNIRVNAVCPGTVKGERLDMLVDEEVKYKGLSKDKIIESYVNGTSLKKIVESKDVANMIYFLASQEARLVTGQIISVDGNTETMDPKV